MRYKRKPVVRDVVDALKGATHYFVIGENSGISEIPHADFELDYEPVKRSPSTKPRKVRKKKDAVT